MEVPFFDLKEPRASLMQVPNGLVSQYAFDQEPALLQIELPTTDMYCLMGHQLVRGRITGLGLDTFTWQLSAEDARRFPIFANRDLWALYGEVTLGRDLTRVRLNGRGRDRLVKASYRPHHLAVADFEAQASHLYLRSAFAGGAFYSAWAGLPHATLPFPDIFAHEVEHVGGPSLEDAFSFADLLSEIELAKRRKAALQDAIMCRASADVIESERIALLNVRFGKALHQGLLNTLQ
ncbi:hypothetical protein [Thauera sp. WH-1]|uniref:hypothetical protein n=1 Tax=Thauera sp. WH-1 TaxID=3398230 RepID=UPI0039FD4E7D